MDEDMRDRVDAAVESLKAAGLPDQAARLTSIMSARAQVARLTERVERAEADAADLRARIAAALAVTDRIGYRPAQEALRAALTDEQFKRGDEQ